MLNLKQFCCVAAILALVGCATETKDPTAGKTAQQIYQEAKEFVDTVQYAKAIPYFDKVEGMAAGTILGEQAQLDKAFAQYKNGDQLLALATLDRFMRLHPTHPATDYAIYLKGVVAYKSNDGLLERWFPQELAERDTDAAKVAFDVFKTLLNRFPDSKYAPDAKKRMAYIASSLVVTEVKIAQFYLERGAYVAAVNRAQQILLDFPQDASTEKALEILVRAYDKLGIRQLRDDNLRVLKRTFPDNALSKSMFLDSSTLSDAPAKPASPTVANPKSDKPAKPWYKIW